MNIPDLDLRDLVVFSMLMQHHSVTKVAAALNLPQPTVSRCVTRLREQFRDVLFVRTRSGMEPTSIALAAAPAVNDIVVFMQRSCQILENSIPRFRAANLRWRPPTWATSSCFRVYSAKWHLKRHA
jgi:DNA-binding transcriptional LysR family regulator